MLYDNLVRLAFNVLDLTLLNPSLPSLVGSIAYSTSLTRIIYSLSAKYPLLNIRH